MPTNPVSGAIAVLKKGTNVAPGMNWDLDQDAKLRDCANFKDGRRQKATLPDADFSVTMLWDGDSMPHDPAGLGFVPGAEITVDCFVGLTAKYVVPIVIGKCKVSSKIEEIVMYDVSGKQNGPIIPPVITP
jgi:hypothetical protein